MPVIAHVKEFNDLFPCMYSPDTCRECKGRVTCDMRAGRELHEKYYNAGVNSVHEALEEIRRYFKRCE